MGLIGGRIVGLLGGSLISLPAFGITNGFPARWRRWWVFLPEWCANYSRRKKTCGTSARSLSEYSPWLWKLARYAKGNWAMLPLFTCAALW